MISIVIPTLQKSKETLYNLIETLDLDEKVDEIIVIDNSLKGIEHISQKVKVIIPEENLYVNPSWNLGVKKALNSKIGLLNDDIAISSDFCSQISALMDKEMGILGMDSDFVIETNKIENNPESKTIELKPVDYRLGWFGTAMFFHRNAYNPIPDEIKIYYGDDWIFNVSKDNKKQNYMISNQEIFHLGSLSSKIKAFNPILKKDGEIYRKLRTTFLKRMLSFEDYKDCHKLRILGLTFKFKK